MAKSISVGTQNFLDQTNREKKNAYNLLIGLIQSLHSRSLLIDLTNNTQIAGKLELCDGFMNLTLSNVVFIDVDNKQYGFDQFMIRKRSIRYIHLPKDVSYFIFIKFIANKSNFRLCYAHVVYSVLTFSY